MGSDYSEVQHSMCAFISSGSVRCWIYLDLLKRDLEAEGLVVIRVEGVLLDCRLLLLQPLSILHQVDLRIWICGVTFKLF